MSQNKAKSWTRSWTKSRAKPKTILLDARSGGLGDVWMRLVGLYAAAALRPQQTIRACFAPPIRALAAWTFSDRIEFLDVPPMGAKTGEETWIYTHRGLRDLWRGVSAGNRYLAPLHRVVDHLAKRNDAKAQSNRAFFALLHRLGRVSIAPKHALEHYCGYLETTVIPAFSDISPEEFFDQVCADYPALQKRMGQLVPPPVETLQNADAEIAVFPSGQAHQYMPVAWARQHLPQALFCFHLSDPGASLFEREGLAVARFAVPEQIPALARGRRRIVTTDSFPSHVLQYDTGSLTILLTRTERVTVVSPGFKGNVIASTASCCPCPYLERVAFPLCKEGHAACVAWNDPAWTSRALLAAR